MVAQLDVGCVISQLVDMVGSPQAICAGGCMGCIRVAMDRAVESRASGRVNTVGDGMATA